jgi:dUTP pyrophosphatase
VLIAPSAQCIQVQLLHPAAKRPARSYEGDAGYDLCCVEAFHLRPGERRVVGSGLALALPPGLAALVIPRSGLAARHGLSVVNGPGLVDPNYRGEIRMVLVNLGDEPFAAAIGDRVAQLLFVPFVAPDIEAVGHLAPATDERGPNGFGSSGR